jgi:LacI family transcriptional regulator
VVRALKAAGERGPTLARVTVHEWRAAEGGSLETTVARCARDLPDALICYDDRLALRTIDALRALGILVPRDAAVAGFDDIPFAAIAHPRLTTVAQRSEEMGRLAVGMLRAVIETGRLPRSITLPVQVVVRESSARPQRRAPRAGPA